ncbi:MAG: iron ABC transporter permease, partial [Muribaculaceae bacterium]|nr:iron ABC transporter permease [Muribaculaceae bacterium]
MISRRALVFTIMGVAIVTLFVVDMTTGSSVLSVGEVWSALLGDSDPSTVKIVCGIRLTKAIVAIIAGLALAVSGLQMQTLFCNPLAGPYVLGITSGASLGVALFILGASAFGIGDALGFFGDFGVAGAALAGAALVLAVIAAVGSRIKDIMVILILGMMFSSGIGAIVQILQYLSHEDALKAYVVWTMGSLGDVTSDQLIILAVASFAGLILAVAAI